MGVFLFFSSFQSPSLFGFTQDSFGLNPRVHPGQPEPLTCVVDGVVPVLFLVFRARLCSRRLLVIDVCCLLTFVADGIVSVSVLFFFFSEPG